MWHKPLSEQANDANQPSPGAADARANPSATEPGDAASAKALPEAGPSASVDPAAVSASDSSRAGEAGAANEANAVTQLLAIGLDRAFTDRLDQWAAAETRVELSTAPTLKAARQCLDQQASDLVLLAPEIADGCGLTFAEELARRPRITQTVLVTNEPTVDLAAAAMRAGAADLIDPALDWANLHQRLQQVLTRPTRACVQARRAERLQQRCQRLQSARDQVNDQVDVLCKDLVTAYQDLADQLDQAMHGVEYNALLENELDLETLIRRTIEFLIGKLGQANGVVYLPCSADEYSVGGFVGYEAADGPPEVLLDELGDRLAPVIAQQSEPVHLTDEEQMQPWIDETLGMLAEQHLIAMPCQHEGETLAVVVLFRDQAEPFDPQARDIAAAVASRFGEAIGRMIRIHHRHIPEPEETDEPESPDFDGEASPYDF